MYGYGSMKHNKSTNFNLRCWVVLGCSPFLAKCSIARTAKMVHFLLRRDRRMIYTKTNVASINLNDLLDFKIRIVSKSTRRGSNKVFNGKPNCSGFNINKYIKDGMTVAQYQAVIRNNFSANDPQFSLTKHLKHDILVGYFLLEK